MYDYIKEKPRKKRKVVDKKIRKLKVYEVSGRGYKRVSQIRVTGEWLKRFGFNIGDEIDIIFSKMIQNKTQKSLDKWF